MTSQDCQSVEESALDSMSISDNEDYVTGNVLDSEATRLGIQLSSRDRDAFNRYFELLRDGTKRASLTSLRTRDQIEQRLFGESLALLVGLRNANLVHSDKPIRVADIGSGGGFPGIPMRILESTMQLFLIEAQQRRCAFLESVTEQLSLNNVQVLHSRAEDAGRNTKLRASFDLVVARAVAPLDILVEYALPLLQVGGILATPKGSNASKELTEAEIAIEELGGIALDPIPLSLPEQAPSQNVLVIRRQGKLNDRYPRRAGIPSKRRLR